LTTSGIIDARPRVGYFYTGIMSNGVSEALSRFNAGDIKSRPIVIRDNATVYDAIVMLFIEDVGTLFVVDEKGFLQGVVSRKDFLKSAMSGADFHKIPVGVIMTQLPQLHTVTEDESVLQVTRTICENAVDSLPVIRQGAQGCKVVGRVTKTNLAHLLMELGEGR
jgi:CBS domain-containing protein